MPDTGEGGILGGGGLIDGRIEASEDSADTAFIEHKPPTEVGIAGGGGCAHTPGFSWTFVIVWLLRAALCVPLVAHGADFQNLQTLEGGRFTSVRSTDPGPKWSGRVNFGTQWANRPLTLLMSDSSRRNLVRHALTAELAASLNIGDVFTLGAAFPTHWAEKGGQISKHSGDLRLWAMLPVAGQGSPLAFRAAYEAPTRRIDNWEELWSAKAAVFDVASEHPMGRATVGWHTGVRLQPKDVVSGFEIGSRVEGAMGISAPLIGTRVQGSFEVFGSFPTHLPKSVLEVPLEALVGTQTRLAGQVDLNAGFGYGITRAPGSPATRVTLGVSVSGHDPRDSDGDGIRNLVDQCKQEPEDFDRFHDKDGCPDPDNDGDGLLDIEDECPDEPETRNAYLDEDGCPDALARWVVTVEGPEVYTLHHGGETTRNLTDEVWVNEQPPGRASLLLEAPGFHPEGVQRDLRAGTTQTTVEMQPILTGQLVVQVANPDGESVPLSVLNIEGEPGPLEDGWYAGTQNIGRVNLVATAPGHEGTVLAVDVEEGQVTTAVVTLQPLEVELTGREIRLGESSLFAVDSARLENTDWLEALAAWLKAHPEAELVRVEGHADSTGSSAYNLGLSQERATVVRRALIDRGIAAKRLVSVGSGEALAWSGPERMVSFTVLVHAEW